MLKRILLGLICGWGLSALFLISVSLVAPPPGEGRDVDIARQVRQPNLPIQLEREADAPAQPEALPQRQVVAEAPDVASPADGVPLPEGSQFNRPREDGAVVVTESERVARPALPVATPGLEDAPTAPRAQTATVTQPRAVQTVTSANAPEVGLAPSVPSLSSDAAPRTFRDTRLAENVALPATERVETDPATPGAAALAPAEQAPAVGAETTPQLAEVPSADIAPEDPSVDLTEVAVLPVPDAVTAPEPGGVPAPEGPAIARVVPAEPEPAAPEAPAETDPSPAAAPDVAADEVEDEAAAQIASRDDGTGTGDAQSDDEAPGIRILQTDRPLATPGLSGSRTATDDRSAPQAGTAERLPRRLILDSERDAPDEDETAEAAPEPAETPADQPALLAHASPFDNLGGRPLLAIVLIDGGADAGAVPEFPVTVAIDGAARNARGRAQAIRDAGQEVMLLADALSMNGAPQDVEIALAGARNAVPQALAVLDRPEDGFAANRGALAGLLPALSDAGMGFLTYPSGLGSGLSTARREGVAAAPVLRRIDEVGEGLDSMDRVLGRAAFEAGRDGSAVVVVTMRPDILAALDDWAASPTADGIALAPISAVLRPDDTGN